MALLKKNASNNREQELTPDFVTATPETPKAPEQNPEQEKSIVEGQERVPKSEGDKPDMVGRAVSNQSKKSQSQQIPEPFQKTEEVKQIENILSEDLGDLYKGLDDAHRKLFKEEGERTARKIDELFRTGKAVARRVMDLIRNWLKVVPGISKFFIEQETKIKADKIMQERESQDKN